MPLTATEVHPETTFTKFMKGCKARVYGRSGQKKYLNERRHCTLLNKTLPNLRIFALSHRIREARNCFHHIDRIFVLVQKDSIPNAKIESYCFNLKDGLGIFFSCPKQKKEKIKIFFIPSALECMPLYQRNHNLVGWNESTE
jgi:hypothetical protein